MIYGQSHASHRFPLRSNLAQTDLLSVTVLLRTPSNSRRRLPSVHTMSGTLDVQAHEREHSVSRCSAARLPIRLLMLFLSVTSAADADDDHSRQLEALGSDLMAKRQFAQAVEVHRRLVWGAARAGAKPEHRLTFVASYLMLHAGCEVYGVTAAYTWPRWPRASSPPATTTLRGASSRRR
jgi:hypothetical protein